MSTTRETLKSFFNKEGEPGKTKISYGLDNETGTNISLNDENDISTIDEEGNKKDLIEGFLGDYVNFLLKEAKHLYYPNKGNQLKPLYTRGDSITTVNSENSVGRSYFVDSSEQSKELNKISLSDYLRDNEISPLNEEFPIDKTGEDPDRSGNNILKDIEGTGLDTTGNLLAGNDNDDENKTINLIQNYLRKNNRFSNVSPEVPYTAENVEEREININNEFGVHDKENYSTGLEQLKALGASLLSKISGFGEMHNKNFSDKISGTNFKNQPSDNYRPIGSDIYPKDESGNTIRKNSGAIIDPDSNSFGSTYNTEMHFYGKNKKLHKIHALIAAKSIYLIYENIYASIFEDLTEKSSEILQDINKVLEQDLGFANWADDVYGKAKSMLNLRLDEKRSKYLVRTIYPYKNCVDRGLELSLGPNSIVLESAIRGPNAPEPIDDLNPTISNSPGFWLAVCTNVIRNVDASIQTVESISEETNDDTILRELMFSVSKSPLIRFFNAMATIGDISLRATMGNPLDTPEEDIAKERPFDIDQLEDLPGNRVGKSRMKNGKRVNQLFWSQNNVPSVYMLPVNAVRASVKLDKGPSGPNIIRSMFGSELVENTYLDMSNDGAGSRIPKEVVKTIEDKLEAEYVPFYVQDLRTNEIISFHAFLSSLTDQISPTFNSEGGYGRLDDVHIYQGTKRSVTCDFTLMATSREDFDSMWFKINKITTLLYPQWTQGTRVGNSNTGTFIQPFSQVIGASPIVRLRIGDVIKSNYSKFNLARIFGVGDAGINMNDVGLGIPLPDAANSVFNTISEVALFTLIAGIGSPLQLTNTVSSNVLKNNIPIASKGLSAVTETVSLLLKNGFVNPLAFDPVNNQITDPQSNYKSLINVLGFGYAKGLGTALSQGVGLPDDVGDMSGVGNLVLKSNVTSGYRLVETGEKIYFNRPVTIQVKGQTSVESIYGKNQRRTRTGYRCSLTDPTLLGTDLFGAQIEVLHEDIYPLPDAIFSNTLIAPGLAALATGPISAASNNAGEALKKLASTGISIGGSNISIANSAVDLATDLIDTNENKFMLAENNPFVRGFETTMGRGLAGKLGGITFNWISEFPWETDYNARAPIGVKISFTLDVIHDLPPGLDHAGFNRAPLYNVGGIMRGIAGDVYNDNGIGGEINYKKSNNIKKG